MSPPSRRLPWLETEQIRGDGPAFPMAFAPRDVIGKNLAGRCVQRHEARLAEFAVADRQQRHLEGPRPGVRDSALHRDVGRRHSVVQTDNGRSKVAACRTHNGRACPASRAVSLEFHRPSRGMVSALIEMATSHRGESRFVDRWHYDDAQIRGTKHSRRAQCAG